MVELQPLRRSRLGRKCPCTNCFWHIHWLCTSISSFCPTATRSATSHTLQKISPGRSWELFREVAAEEAMQPFRIGDTPGLCGYVTGDVYVGYIDWTWKSILGAGVYWVESLIGAWDTYLDLVRWRMRSCMDCLSSWIPCLSHCVGDVPLHTIKKSFFRKHYLAASDFGALSRIVACFTIWVRLQFKDWFLEEHPKTLSNECHT